MIWLDSKVDKPDFDFKLKYINAIMQRGIRVSRPVDIEAQAAKMANEIAMQLHSEYGLNNPASPAQIVDTFMANSTDENILSVCYNTKKQKFSTNEDNLIALANMGYKWAVEILLYRKNNGIVKNIESVMSRADADGLIHPQISLQKTNRVSYKEPALGNINTDILWSMIKPYKEGNHIWSVDIKNQEPWILIHLIGAKQLKALTEKASDTNSSIYKAIYEEVFGHSIESEEAYKEMKMAWNMLTYGGTYNGLASRCKIIDAKRVYDFFNSVPELKAYRGRTFGLAKKGINSVKTVFGTTVYADKEGGALQRSLMDIPIQGTGADILALLLVNIDRQLFELGLSEVISVYYTRHDEIIFEVDGDWQKEVGADEVRDALRVLTEHRIDDWTPFGIDIEQLV